MGLEFQTSDALKRMALELRQASRWIQAEVGRELKPVVAKLLADEFSTKIDPYGKPWKPPKAGGETMVKTGRLKRGFTFRVVPGSDGLELRVDNKQVYKDWLQQGTSRMEARKMLPDGALPPTWRAAFDAVYVKAVEKWWDKVAGGK